VCHKSAGSGYPVATFVHSSGHCQERADWLDPAAMNAYFVSSLS
jgi:hypothetical protein